MAGTDSDAKGFVRPDDDDLRDRLAMAALQGIVANDPIVSKLLPMFGGPGMSRGDVAAKVAYLYADAMLRARKGGK